MPFVTSSGECSSVKMVKCDTLIFSHDGMHLHKINVCNMYSKLLKYAFLNNMIKNEGIIMQTSGCVDYYFFKFRGFKLIC